MTPAALDTLARAIAAQEGFGVAGARPTRNHNPGDLRGWFPYPADADGFTIFPDDATGWAALKQDLTNHAAKYPDQCLLSFIGGDQHDGWPGYAPSSDGNFPSSYATALATALGCSIFTRFSELA